MFLQTENLEATTIEDLTSGIMEELDTTLPYLEDENATVLPETSSTPVDDLMCSQLVTMTTIAMLSLAITVNLISLAAVSCDPKRRTTRANIYAASFFTAEIIYSLNALIANYQRFFLEATDYEHVIAHGYLFLEFTCRGAMVASLGGVVFDRYRAIYNVTSYCPRKRLCSSCCFAVAGWLVAVLLAAPVLAGLTDYWYTPYNSLRPFDVYIGIHSLLVYFLPLIVFSLAFNILMCRLLTCSSRRSLDSCATKGNNMERSTRRRLAMGIIATVAAFGFSWIIYVSVRVIDGYFPPSDFEPINMAALRLAGNFVAYMGLSVCPVLVCVACADYTSLDTQRCCTCCSDNQNFVSKIEQAWPSAKPNPYYI